VRADVFSRECKTAITVIYFTDVRNIPWQWPICNISRKVLLTAQVINTFKLMIHFKTKEWDQIGFNNSPDTKIPSTVSPHINSICPVTSHHISSMHQNILDDHYLLFHTFFKYMKHGKNILAHIRRCQCHTCRILWWDKNCNTRRAKCRQISIVKTVTCQIPTFVII
jgi:hypothetical protein